MSRTETILAKRSTKGGIYDFGDGPVGILPLDGLLFAVVDADRYAEFNQYAWSVNRQGYVFRRDYTINKQVFLHRIVNETPEGWITDHINGGKLWCRGQSLTGPLWHVTCYSEDETPARLEMMRRANERLAGGGPTEREES
jgi:hypothetical protein